MNKKQKIQMSLAVLCAVYIIVWLFLPGWEVAKILGIISGVCILIALYGSYRAEEKIKQIPTSKFQFNERTVYEHAVDET